MDEEINQEENYEEDYLEPDAGGYEDDNPAVSQVGHQDTVDRFFNTEAFLHQLKMSLLGYKIENNQYINTGRGVARTEFIEQIINSLRSVINTSFILSTLSSEEDVNRLLLEKNKEIIFAIYDEDSVEDHSVEYLINVVDHSLQLYVGMIQSDKAGERAAQMNINNYENLMNKENNGNRPMFRFGTSNRDILNIGGGKGE